MHPRGQESPPGDIFVSGGEGAGAVFNSIN